MSQITDKVMPGDLITAGLLNRIIDEVNLLQTKVASLEAVSPASGKVVILDIQPQTPRVNEEMRISGQNFNFTTGQTQLRLDGVQVNTFTSGTGDQLLIFKIPFIPNIPPQGRPVLVEVSNLNSTDVRSPTILPLQLVLEGGIDVTYQGVDPLTFSPGGQVTFRYRLKSKASLNANFTITPEVIVDSNAAAWNAQLKVLNSQQVEVPDRRIPLNVNEEKDVFVRIQTVPPNTNNVKFKLTVTAGSGGVSNADGPREFTVGQTAVLPDPDISMSVPTPPASPGFFPNGASLDRNTSPPTIRIPKPSSGQNAVRLHVTAGLKAPTEYIATVTLTNATGWTAVVNTQNLTNPFPVGEGEFLNTTEVTKELRFNIAALTNASSTGDLEIELKKTNSSQKRTLPLKVALI